MPYLPFVLPGEIADIVNRLLTTIPIERLKNVSNDFTRAESGKMLVFLPIPAINLMKIIDPASVKLSFRPPLSVSGTIVEANQAYDLPPTLISRK